MHIVLKRMLMAILYAALEIAGRLKRQNLENVKRVAVLFAKPLGIGDLIMLSPAIQEIVNLFPEAEVELVTWIPPIVDFKRIKWVGAREAKSRRYDLIISPTLNLRHCQYVFRTKSWLGYFARPKLQSNFGAVKNEYDLAKGHYLWRGVQLIKALDGKTGARLEEDFKKRAIIYPPIVTSEPQEYVQSLGNSKYLLLAVFSKFKDRQWSMNKIAEIAGKLSREDKFDQVVITGDDSNHNKLKAEELRALLKAEGVSEAVDLTGKTTLPETAYLINHCSLFIGLDSGPSHLAYALAPKGAVIFTVVKPEERLPLISGLDDRIACVRPSTSLPLPYSGLAPVNLSKARNYIDSISVESVEDAIGELILKI